MPIVVALRFGVHVTEPADRPCRDGLDGLVDPLTRYNRLQVERAGRLRQRAARPSTTPPRATSA